jgi:hypothetical protein
MAHNPPAETVPRSILMLIVATVSAAVATVLADRMPEVLAQFGTLFNGFSFRPSAITTWVLNHPKAWWLFADLSIVTFLWVAVRGRVSPIELARMKLALRLTIGLTVLAYGVAAYAMYSPIFQLGKVV